MSETALAAVPGGQALIDWFGRVHHFHDAELLEVKLVSNGPSTLRIRTWRMTDKVDARGYFVLDKHIVVTILMEGITHIELDHFHLPAIIFDLQITRAEDGYWLTWTSSYGVEGSLRAAQLRIDLAPDAPMA